MKCTSTLRGALVRVKQTRPDRKKGVVYEVPYKDCSRVYIWEMGRTLEKRLSKHTTAVKKNDLKNGIALHAWANQHQVNWEAATVKGERRRYWKQRVLESLYTSCTAENDLLIKTFCAFFKLMLWSNISSLTCPFNAIHGAVPYTVRYVTCMVHLKI